MISPATEGTRATRPVYGSSTVKRQRRTRAELFGLDLELRGLVERHRPATVRQVFYLASVRGLVPKTEKGYRLVVRRLTHLRRDRGLPYWWIADNTRWMRKSESYNGLRDFLARQVRFYRRALWADSEDYVEVWLEKDALAGVIFDVTDEYDVPLMVTRGFSSLSFLNTAAEAMKATAKRPFVYYFGDLDPTGVCIPRKVREFLADRVPGLTFERVAVTREQVRAWGLPTRPTKRSDSRARNFKGESVELDAIPPDRLRELVRNVIEKHIDATELERLERIESAERQTLKRIADRLGDGELDLESTI